jgi:ATP-dependent RNA helicase DeaD
VKTFADFPLLDSIKKSLDALGFTTPTEIQAKVIPFLLEHDRDVHAQAQTGTGKTLAFGIPLLHKVDPNLKTVQALVIAPTRELVLQIYENLRDASRSSNIAVEPIYGGMPITRQITNIRRGAQIIVGTPGRLNDHLRRGTLTLKSVKVLVLDEADIMLDMGFKEEINDILEHMPTDRNIWLFSATVGGGIKDLIKSHMHDVYSVKVSGKDVVSTQVKQYFCIVPPRKRIEAIARFIEADPNFYGILFCQTKLLTSEVVEQLSSRGFRANCLHGDMSQALRNQVIKGFKNKDFNILVATDVAGRGIDVSDLTHVINYSIPREHENYIHRIGRTGRAGKEGIAIAFVAPADMRQIKRLEAAAHTTLQEISVPTLETIINAKMGAVSDFIEQSKKPADKLSAVDKALGELIDSFTPEEIRHSFAAALENRFFKDIIHEDLGTVRADSGGAVPQEICVELGTDMGLSEEEMRSYLLTTCKLSPHELTKVRVLQKKTFICVPENRLNECLGMMRAKPIAKKKYKIYLVEDTYRSGDERPQRRNKRDRFRDMRKKHGKGRPNSERRNR